MGLQVVTEVVTFHDLGLPGLARIHPDALSPSVGFPAFFFGRGIWGGVAEAGHQPGDGHASLRGHRDGEVPQVVEPDILPSGDEEDAIEPAVDE